MVGNSLGGWMALKLASYAPERVESLALLASGGLSSIRVPSLMLKALTPRFMGKKWEEGLGRLVYGDIKMPEEVLSFGRLISAHFRPRTRGYGALPDAAFQKLDMPVLYMAGEDDRLLPSKKNAARLRGLVPHALIGLADDISAFIDGKETGSDDRLQRT